MIHESKQKFWHRKEKENINDLFYKKKKKIVVKNDNLTKHETLRHRKYKLGK